MKAGIELSKLGNKRHFQFPYKRIFHKLQCCAKRKNIPCFLSYEEFVEFTKINTCFYCGNRVFWIKHGKKASAYNLDRIKNSKGYQKDNLIVCCWRCNNLKSNSISHEDFIKIAIFLPKTIFQSDYFNYRDSFIDLNNFSLND